MHHDTHKKKNIRRDSRSNGYLLGSNHLVSTAYKLTASGRIFRYNRCNPDGENSTNATNDEKDL